MFPVWTWIVGFWIGAAVGSFLNVVIYRLPRGLSIARPKHSFCPNCKHQLTAPDLVPILSWLFLGRKCRHCKTPVSSRYFWVEVVNGSLWGGIWWLYLSHPDVGGVAALGDPVKAVGFMLFASALVAAIFTDLAHYIIPDQINAFILVVGLGMNVAFVVLGRPEAWIGALPSSIVGALTGVGVLWGIAFFGRLAFRKDAMGHGDIKMARGIGSVLLPFMALTSFGLSVVSGAVFGGTVVLLRVLGKVRDEPAQDDEDEPYEPESIASLLKCGLGYVLCMDVVGLAWPKVYEWWFDENPYSVEEFEEDPRVDLTMIPFGPHLAVGALAAVLFEPQLRGAIGLYIRTFFPSI